MPNKQVGEFYLDEPLVGHLMTKGEFQRYRKDIKPAGSPFSRLPQVKEPTSGPAAESLILIFCGGLHYLTWMIFKGSGGDMVRDPKMGNDMIWSN